MLFLLAALLLVVSIFLPYWQLTLHAPQYPKGLTVRGLPERPGRRRGRDRRAEPLHRHAAAGRGRDLREVDLDHRRCGGGAVGAGRGLRPQPLGGAAGPAGAGFSRSSSWPTCSSGWRTSARTWTRRPPLSSSVKPFVPPVLGVGKIAQFSTDAGPAAGLWLAFAASLLILVGLYFHRRAYKPLVDGGGEELRGTRRNLRNSRGTHWNSRTVDTNSPIHQFTNSPFTN